MIRFFALALISAAILAYEVLLIRLFAIVQWHHFAAMAISIALLGFGASGTLLALWQDRLRPHFTAVFAISAALFGLFAPAAFLAAQALPFNALAILWEPDQLLYLLAMYALLVVPFFCGATCVGIAFVSLGERIGGLYACNLIGSAIGSLGVVGLLFLLSPPEALRVIAAVGFLAAALITARVWRGLAAGSALLALLVGALLPESWFALKISEFKGLPTVLRSAAATVVGERSGPLGLLTAVESPEVPLRYVPGLSLNTPGPPLPQIALFRDGGGLTAITRFDGQRERLAYLDYTTSALPYHLLLEPSVLLFESGGTDGLLQALYHHAGRIDLVEPDRNLLRLIGEDFAEETGALLARPEVQVHVAGARGFAAASRETWDLIVIPFLGGGGLMGLRETHAMTLEAMQLYFDRLAPGGWLAITGWLELPPRQSLKLLATLIAAMEASGIEDPGRHMIGVRGLTTVTLLVKLGRVSADDIARSKAFAAERSFDLVFYPGMPREEANRVNLLEEPYFHDAAQALLGPERAAFLAGYKFDIAPVTDERPHFYDLLKWRSLPELLAISRAGGAGLVELGSLILVTTLIQAAVLSVILILLPLWIRRRSLSPGLPFWRVAGYFLALGLGFLFIEIAFIQKFMLFLGHPLYAIAVVLTAFLLFAGLGSAASAGLDKKAEMCQAIGSICGLRLSAIDLAVAVIILLSLSYLLILPSIFTALVHLNDGAKAIISLILIAPLAFAMGMPFPLGLARLWSAARPLVPWAWGINGCASVISVLLATLTAMNAGFSTVILSAIGLYAAATLTSRLPLTGPNNNPTQTQPFPKQTQREKDG